jgi:hypothetical protein
MRVMGGLLGVPFSLHERRMMPLWEASSNVKVHATLQFS